MQSSFLLFCHRFFELRFLVVTGIVQELQSHGNVTLMLPESLAHSFKKHLPNTVRIEFADYKSDMSNLRAMILNLLADILYLTFPNTHILPNATAKFHRDHYTTNRKITKFLVVNASILASKSKLFRSMCQSIFKKLLPTQKHEQIIKNVNPDLMIGCSFGMGLEDAAFLAEAHNHSIPSAVIVQSWDRTSNKGYPTIRPDHALVWNDIMKKECNIHLGFKNDSVHVTGSPLWDTHFNILKKAPDTEWRSNLKISYDSKVLFFSCGGFGSHPANMKVIPIIFELAKTQPFQDKVHIVFRMYPQYLSPAAQSGTGKTKKDEIEALLAKYQDQENLSILYPEVEFDGKNFMPTATDHSYMTECLRQCDVSISQVSSQMIEACIFDKPAINAEFGRRVTDKYDLEISDYKTEHLLRVYRTEAIYRVKAPEMLQKTIEDALKYPKEKAKQRISLVDQEAPLNRGISAKQTALTLSKIAQA